MHFSHAVEKLTWPIQDSSLYTKPFFSEPIHVSLWKPLEAFRSPSVRDFQICVGLLESFEVKWDFLKLLKNGACLHMTSEDPRIQKPLEALHE